MTATATTAVERERVRLAVQAQMDEARRQYTLYAEEPYTQRAFWASAGKMDVLRSLARDLGVALDGDWH